MNKIACKAIVGVIRQRLAEGDCTSTVLPHHGVLEDCILELADQLDAIGSGQDRAMLDSLLLELRNLADAWDGLSGTLSTSLELHVMAKGEAYARIVNVLRAMLRDYALRRYDPPISPQPAPSADTVDGWRHGTNDGAPCMYAPRGGFVAFNEDMSALYVADVRELPFSVIDELRRIGAKL